MHPFFLTVKFFCLTHFYPYDKTKYVNVISFVKMDYQILFCHQ